MSEPPDLPPQRKIIHVDMDAFYASVEQRDRPELRGRPVIVAWSPEPRGVVVAASYEARTFGVRSAMPATRALRLCPDATWVRPDFTRYKTVSAQIREIFLRHTDLVEPLSLDEAYLDVTIERTGIPTATETAEMIRREIREETGLTASAGVAPNKFLAKIASDWNKPDGIFVIRPHQVIRFLEPLPVGKIPGVGKATEQRLEEQGIRIVAELRNIDRETLHQRFGKFGDRLWELARGIDESPVVPNRPLKSVSVENTFETDLTKDEVAMALEEESKRLWETLVKKKRTARTVTVKLRTPRFETATRRLTLPEPVGSLEELVMVALTLLDRFDFPPAAKFRLAGVGVSNFTESESEETQDTLFS